MRPKNPIGPILDEMDHLLRQARIRQIHIENRIKAGGPEMTTEEESFVFGCFDKFDELAKQHEHWKEKTNAT